MKKLLIIVLVFGLASVSNAALVLDDGGGAVAVTNPATDSVLDGSILSLSTDAAVSAWEVSLSVISGTLSIDTSGANFPLAFDFASGFVGAPTATFARMSGSQFLNPATGPGTLVAGLKVVGQGEILITDILNNNTELGVVQVVPEPMTLSLLALGGLGLIRRRRRA